MSDKAGLSAEISALLGTPVRQPAPGGTITRPFLEDVAGSLGVQASGLDKVQLTRALVLRVGQPWDDSCASSHTESGGGGNITRVALDRLLLGIRNQVEELPEVNPSILVPPTATDLTWRQAYDDVAIELNSAGHLDVDNLEDERWRTFSAVVQRRGQAEFRRRLLRAYAGRCAITGCDAVAALEAAHVVPYLGPSTNVTRNGLLLRSDVHTLFDLGLLGIRGSDRRVVLDEQLHGTDYERYSGRPVRAPRRPDDAVDREALAWRAEHIGPAAAGT